MWNNGIAEQWNHSTCAGALFYPLVLLCFLLVMNGFELCELATVDAHGSLTHSLEPMQAVQLRPYMSRSVCLIMLSGRRLCVRCHAEKLTQTHAFSNVVHKRVRWEPAGLRYQAQEAVVRGGDQNPVRPRIVLELPNPRLVGLGVAPAQDAIQQAVGPSLH